MGLALALVPAAWSATHALVDGWVPAGDDALIALRVGDVFTAQTPLVGQPSTSDLYGASKARHPGPMGFWALAVPYALLGPAVGLVIGATLVNAAAIAGVGFVAFRREGVLFALWSLLLVTVLCWGLGSNFLHDPISSNAATFMVVLLFFLVWSLAVGDIRLLPLTALVVTFVFQDHLSVLGQNALFVVAGAVALGWELNRHRRRSPAHWQAYRSILSKWVAWSLLAVVVLWAPVVIQQFTGAQGNLSEIYRTYTYNTGHAHGVAWSVDRLSTALGPLPMFARSFGLEDLGYLDVPTGAARYSFVLPLIALVVLAALAARRKARRALLLALTALAALASGLYSAMSLPVSGQPELKQSAVRWMWMGSLFVWLAIGWLAWQAVPPARRRRAAGVAGVVLLATMLGGSVLASASAARPERDGARFAELAEKLPKVRAALRPGDYFIQFGGFESGLTIGPAVALDIHDHGHGIRAPRDLERAFGTERTYDPSSDKDLTGTVSVIDQVVSHDADRLVAVIPNLSSAVRRELGEPLARTESGLRRSGGLKLTDKGRRLAATGGRVGPVERRQLSVVLGDQDALLATGLIAPALAEDYVEPFGVDQDTLDNLAAAIDSGDVTTYSAVFVGPPPG